MNIDPAAIPSEVLANLVDKGPYAVGDLGPLARTYRVLRDLGYRGTEPFAAGYAYALLTDGSSWLSESLRRIVGSESTRYLLRRVNRKLTDSSTVTYFSSNFVDHEHKTWAARYPRLWSEHPEIFPLLHALVGADEPNELLLLSDIQAVLPPDKVADIERRLHDWLSSAASPLAVS